MSDSPATPAAYSNLEEISPLEELLPALLDISLTGVIFFKPVYHADTGEIIDLAYVKLNAAAQRMLQLPERPDKTFLQLYPHAHQTGIFAFYRDTFLTGKPGRYDLNYQYDRLNNYFQLAAQRSGQGLIVSFNDTSDHDRTAVEKALRESQELEKKARAEAELQQQRLHQIFMEAPALICIFEGPQHIFKLVNPPYQRLVGDRPLLGKPIAEAMPELAGQPIFGLLNKVYRTGESFHAHEMLVQLDHNNSGGDLGQNYYNFIYQATRNLSGEIDGILVFAYEVTAQVRARWQVEYNRQHVQDLNEEMQATNEELLTTNNDLVNTQLALQQLNEELEARVAERTREVKDAQVATERQRERLERFFMQAPAAICILDGPNLVYELVNPSYQQLFPGRQLLGKPLLEALPELAGHTVWRTLQQVYQTGKTHTEYGILIPIARHENAPLEDIYFNYIQQGRYDEYGRVDGVLVFAFEVTEQVKAQQRADALQAEVLAATQFQVQEREAFYQVFEQTPACIVLLRGPEHRVDYYNLAYQQLFPGRQMKGKTIAEIQPEALEQGFVALLDKVYQTGETFYGNELLLTIEQVPDGSTKNIFFNFTYQAYRENDQIVGISVFAFDVTGQVMARREAEQQQQLLHTLFMEAPAPILILDGPELVYQLVNPAYQQIFPGRELLGKKLLEALPELKDSPLPAILDNVYKTGETYVAQELPLMLARYEGGPLEEIYWTFTYQARYNAQGIIDGALVFAYEVTDQVKARKTIEENAQQLKLITDALPVLISYLDKEETYRFVNKAYEAWFNQKPEDLLGKPVRQVVGEAAYQGIQDYVKRALAGERLDFEVRMPYRENFIKHISTNYVPDIREGEVLGFYAMVSDITEQVVAQQRVAQAAAELRVVAANAPVFIFRTDAAGQINYVNETLFEWSGLEPNTSQLNAVWELIHPEDRPLIQESFATSIGTNQAWESPAYRIRRRDGEYRWSITRTQPYFNADGQLVGFTGVNVDIHEQIVLQKQLTRTNVDLDNFIYTASHDLKAPILNIEGLMEALLDQMPPDFLEQDTVKQTTELILESVQRFKRTIDHLTEITKLQKENTPEAEVVNLASIIAEVQLDLAPVILAEQAQITVDVTSCPTIRFSEKNLRSIIYNLLSNAIKYRAAERTPQVRVHCFVIPGYEVLAVQDNGLGINLNQESKLFAMFKRLHNHVEGTGIGLYMVKKIIENAGGKIEVQSKVGEGSTFQIFFPRNT
ncbi:PAS domain-containing protein [Adhaeribacter pallidiroseus]|uniref:histidine kinase n=1 Tax=Adhaeribacter pallidiroseus TaxID=2072847 RepID=A0A369QLW4_9BACT|nr:PAS domain-containing protein [Adhaeribacter pallidiroseus]RDC64216.1 Histidine kinase [Adhaeribacter pallidiroseus]